MKKLILIVMIFVLASCTKTEKKPYGAVNIEYDKVEGINNVGPEIIVEHSENIPPVDSSNITYVEVGPPKMDMPNTVEPTADMDEEPDYGGIPIVTKARNE